MPQPNRAPRTEAPSWVSMLLMVVALAVIAGLTIFVVSHYRRSATDAASVLGVALPAVTAVIAAVLGFHAGNTTGQSRGRAAQAEHVRETLTPLVRTALNSYAELASKVEAAAEAPAGGSELRLSTPPGTADQLIQTEELSKGRQSLSELNGFLSGLSD